MLRLTFFMIALILFCRCECAARDLSLQKLGSQITDDAANNAIRVALTKIQTATCEANKPCSPATPEELKQAPINLDDGRAAMAFAIKSALATWCGLDWRRSFLPMIAFGKHQKKMDDRQLQLMTLIHADFQSRQLVTYTKSGQCPAKFKERLDADLAKLRQ